MPQDNNEWINNHLHIINDFLKVNIHISDRSSMPSMSADGRHTMINIVCRMDIAKLSI